MTAEGSKCQGHTRDEDCSTSEGWGEKRGGGRGGEQQQ